MKNLNLAGASIALISHFTLFLGVALLQSGCGATNPLEDLCTIAQVSDYNQVAISCGSANTYSTAQSCVAKGDSFLSKYPSVNCRASQADPNSVNEVSVQITLPAGCNS